MASRKDSRRFGAIDVLPSGNVRARYRDRDGVRHSQSFTGKQAEQKATKWLAAAETDLDRGVQVDHRKSRATFGEFAEHYFETRGGHARTTRARDLVWYRVHIAPTWKSVRFEQIRPESVDSWISQLRKTHVNDDPDRPTLAPATVWDIFVVFRKIILAAQRRGFLTTSPIPDDVAEILPKKRRQKALRFLTEAEVTRLARAFNAPWDVLVYVAAYGGLRLGELAALRAEDFDFLRRTVYVDEAVTDVEGILDYGDPKSETSIRTVSLPDEVMALVRQHIETTVGWNSSTAFLFTSAQGMPFRANNWRSRTWSKAVAAAGLAPLTPHDLRHTAASFRRRCRPRPGRREAWTRHPVERQDLRPPSSRARRGSPQAPEQAVPAWCQRQGRGGHGSATGRWARRFRLVARPRSPGMSRRPGGHR